MDEKDRVEQFGIVTRPIVTILFTVAVIVGFLQGKLSSDAFLGIATSAITFWFIRQSAKEDAKMVAPLLSSPLTPPPPPVPATTTTGDQKGT